jgi:EF hand
LANVALIPTAVQICSLSASFLHLFLTYIVRSSSSFLLVIAHKSTSAEIGMLRKIFQQYDTDGVGHLNYEQFKAAIADTNLTEDDYERIFDAVVRFLLF